MGFGPPLPQLCVALREHTHCYKFKSSLPVTKGVNTDFSYYPYAADLACFFLLDYSYSSADIVLSIIKFLFHQTFEVFFGFVIFFAIHKHQSVYA